MARDTRSELMDSAEAFVRRRGFDGFSYADLAADIGIRKASIHYHFPTKAELSASLMRRYREDMSRFLDAQEAAEATGAERLSRLIRRYRDALGVGERLCLCVAFVVGRESLDAETREEIARYRSMMTNWLGAVFRTGREDGSISLVGDPSGEAAAALALLEGAQLAARAVEDVTVFDSALLLLRARLRR